MILGKPIWQLLASATGWEMGLMPHTIAMNAHCAYSVLAYLLPLLAQQPGVLLLVLLPAQVAWTS